MAKTKGIYKHGSVYWIRYAGLDGKTVYESSKSTKFKDAQTLLVKRKAAVAEGKKPDVKKITNCTFRELVEKYVTWMEGRHKSADTQKYRISSMIENFGTLPLRRFNTHKVVLSQQSFRGVRRAKINKIAHVN